MPIYEYECSDCGHRLEKLQKISDAPLLECPVCSEPTLKKLVSAAAFRLKGSGWYETDFKAGDKKKNLAGDAPSAAEKGGGGAASSDSSASAGGAAKADAGKSTSST